MIVLHISEEDLARDLHSVLDRVQSGTEVIVERNAQPVAILRAPEARRRTLSEIAAAFSEDSTSGLDEYSRIREEILASGLPMLTDDEVRAEVRERKGVRGDSES
jgi:antitoxin (DNA-binding transcriptional repressor) of toxin-antitoxin stability system